MLECPEDAWDKIFEINVKVSFLLFKDCVPHMKVKAKLSEFRHFVIFYIMTFAEKGRRISYIYQLDWRIQCYIRPWSLLCEQDSSDRSH